MKFEQIQSFLTVVQMGSFSRAADALFISQPALIYRIRLLENELGYTLFYREKANGRSVCSIRGVRFIPIAGKWQELWLESQRLPEEHPVPPFRVAATSTLSHYVMPEVFCRFFRRRLPVAPDLRSLHFREICTATERREPDIGLVTRTVPGINTAVRHIASEELLLVCSDRLPCTEPVSASVLPREKEVYLKWSDDYAQWHEAHFGPAGIRTQADNYRLPEEIVFQADCRSVAPASVARVLLKKGGITACRFADPPPPRRIYLLYTEPSPIYLSAFIEDLQSVLCGET